MRTHSRHTLLAMAVVTLLAACGDLTGPESLITTGQSEYVLERDGSGWSVAITFAFHNTTGRTVYVANCNGLTAYHLEKYVRGEWRDAWSPLLLLCASSPITIPDGGRHTETVEVVQSDAGQQFAVWPLEGQYRLVWTPAWEDDLLPLPARTSNPFTLRFES